MDATALAALALKDRDAARQAIDGLSIDAAAQILSQLPSRDAWRLIFLARDPVAVVRALPKGTFFTLFHEIGAADAGELLPLASHEQVELCLDLECWQRGELVVERVDEWLRRLVEAGERTLFRHVARLDFELLVAVFAGRTRVIRRHEDVDPLEMDDPEATTLDDLYYVSFDGVDGERAQTLTEILRVLRDRSPHLAVDLMEALRQELPSVATEDARRLRDNRLCDEGLPNFDDAIEVLARLDARDFDATRHRKLALDTADPDTTGTELVPIVSTDASFLIAALAGLAPRDRSRVEHELAHLTNTVLVAAVDDFSDLVEMRRHATQAVGCLGIGLELVSHGQPADAAELLRTTRLDAIFRVGRTLLTDLATRAKRLAQAVTQAGFGAKATILGHVVTQAIDSLNGPTRVYPRALDSEGEIGTRWFESLEDVGRVDSVLARGEATAVFLFDRLRPSAAGWSATDLTGCTVERLTELSAHQVIATLASNLLLERPDELEPIPVEALPELRRRLATLEHPVAGRSLAIPELERWLEPRLSGLPLAVTGVVRRLVDESVSALARQLGAIREGEPIEPLAIATLVIRAPGIVRGARAEIVST